MFWSYLEVIRETLEGTFAEYQNPDTLQIDQLWRDISLDMQSYSLTKSWFWKAGLTRLLAGIGFSSQLLWTSLPPPLVPAKITLPCIHAIERSVFAEDHCTHDAWDGGKSHFMSVARQSLRGSQHGSTRRLLDSLGKHAVTRRAACPKGLPDAGQTVITERPPSLCHRREFYSIASSLSTQTSKVERCSFEWTA